MVGDGKLRHLLLAILAPACQPLWPVKGDDGFTESSRCVNHTVHPGPRARKARPPCAPLAVHALSLWEKGSVVRGLWLPRRVRVMGHPVVSGRTRTTIVDAASRRTSAPFRFPPAAPGSGRGLGPPQRHEGSRDTETGRRGDAETSSFTGPTTVRLAIVAPAACRRVRWPGRRLPREGTHRRERRERRGSV
jgi:hypothetical protein